MPDDIIHVVGWPTLVFCLGIYFAVFVVRKIVAGVSPKVEGSHYWREVVMPIMPVIFGALASLAATKYPLPAFISSTSSRLFLGAVMGGASGWTYKIFKALIKKQFGIDVSSSASSPPPPPAPSEEAKPKTPPEQGV